MRAGKAAKPLVTGLHGFHIQNLDSRKQNLDLVFCTLKKHNRFFVFRNRNLHPRKVNPEKQNLKQLFWSVEKSILKTVFRKQNLGSVFSRSEKHNRFLVFRNRFCEVVF